MITWVSPVFLLLCSIVIIFWAAYSKGEITTGLRLSAYTLACVLLVCASLTCLQFENYNEKIETRNGCPQCPPCRIPTITSPRKDYIFLSIASYQDERCHNTVEMAFAQAKDPKKLVIGIFEQNAEKIEDCKLGPVANGEIRVATIPAKEATGPATARQRVANLWQGEEIYVQIDAHSKFAKHWDEIVRKSWRERPVPKCIMTTYPVNAVGMKDDKLFENDSVPVISLVYFSSKNLYMQNAMTYHEPGVYTTSRGLGGGCLIAPGIALVEVPLDPTVEGLFNGEEPLWCTRLFTAGYDILSPPRNFVSHLYERKRSEAPVHNVGINFGEANEHAWDIMREEFKTERGRRSRDLGYGHGRVRNLSEYWKQMRMDPSGNTIGKDSAKEWTFQEVGRETK